MSNLVRINTVLFVMLCFASASLAFEPVKILDQSRSQTIYQLNIGNLEGIEMGEVGELYIRSSQSGVLTKVARLRAIKSASGSSYWRISQRYTDFNSDDSIFLARKGVYLKGRSDLKMKRKRIVFDASKNPGRRAKDTLLQDYDRGYPEKLIKKGDGLEATRTLKTTKRPYQQDIDIIDVEQWDVSEDNSDLQKLLGDTSFDEHSKNKKVSPFDFGEKAQESEDLLEEEVLANLEELTNPSQNKTTVKTSIPNKKIEKESIISLVREKQFEEMKETFKERDQDQNFRDKINGIDELGSDDNRFLRNRSTFQALNQDDLIDEGFEAIKRRKIKGDDWSDDLSDQALRRFIVDNGLKSETQRQKFFSKNTTPDNEFSFAYFLDTLDNRSAEDKTQNDFTPGGFRLGYDYQLGRTFSSLNSFTLELSFTKSKTSYGIENLNFKSQEWNFGVVSRWYFWGGPNLIEDVAFYTGLGFRQGKTTLSYVLRGIETDYNIFTGPVLELGTKYRFKKGVGRNVQRYGVGLSSKLTYESQVLTPRTLPLTTDSSLAFNQLKLEFVISFHL